MSLSPVSSGLPAFRKKRRKSISMEHKVIPPRTKLICTIGPGTASVEQLSAMLLAGMDIVRLNFSHGDHKYHSKVINNIREVMFRTHRVCGIMLDTKGPEIRTGRMVDEKEWEITADQKLTLTTDETVIGDNKRIPVMYKNLPKVIAVGNIILIDDGLIQLTVEGIEGTEIFCVANNGGMLGQRKGVNLPGVIVDLPPVTEKDKKDLAFGAEMGVDFIAASFVRKASDVKAVRAALGPKGKNIQIISKIENREGLDNFDEILEASDGIMVARGDLGVEIPIEEVALAQKMMIHKCNASQKFVITATQMLESMIVHTHPTRAEASDVSNAVLDGTDCVMLSGETAKGDNPRKAVAMMTTICREVEGFINYRNLFQQSQTRIPISPDVRTACAAAAVKASFDLGAAALIVMTESGLSARLVSSYRPVARILGVTTQEQTARQMQAWTGIFPLLVGSMVGTYSLIARVIEVAKKLNIVKEGDIVVATVGRVEGRTGGTNEIKILHVQ